jgi:hypothetical protein
MSGAAVDRYRLSFSSGGLHVTYASAAVGIYFESEDWTEVRRELDVRNVVQARTVASAKRVGRELVQRLGELTKAELVILRDGLREERVQLMWVAACRHYEFIAEFAEGVLHERFLLMAPDIAREHYEAFVRGKTLWHPELADLKESTLDELRKSLFKMMREANLLTTEGLIVPAALSVRVRDELAKRNPSDVRLFPTREAA